MGLLDNIKQQIGSQFIEIIQWLDESDDSLVYRFPVYNQEIKMGAQLTVRENRPPSSSTRGRPPTSSCRGGTSSPRRTSRS
jgi:hypothetical protein